MTDRWTDDPQVRDDPALQDFLQRVSTHAPTDVHPGRRADTLEAMLVEAAVSRPADPAPPAWRRRVRRVFAMTGAKVVLVAGVAAAGTTGGLAATGTLPDTAQQFVHEVGQRVGIGVPAAPGQVKAEGEDARDEAPGHLKQEGENAREYAPGQQREGDTPGRSGEAPVGAGDDDADAPGTTDSGDDAVTDPAEESPGDSGDAPGRTGDIPSQDPGEDPPADAGSQDTGSSTDGEEQGKPDDVPPPEDSPGADADEAPDGKADDAPGRTRGEGPATGHGQAPDAEG